MLIPGPTWLITFFKENLWLEEKEDHSEEQEGTNDNTIVHSFVTDYIENKMIEMSELRDKSKLYSGLGDRKLQARAGLTGDTKCKLLHMLSLATVYHL